MRCIHLLKPKEILFLVIMLILLSFIFNPRFLPPAVSRVILTEGHWCVRRVSSHNVSIQQIYSTRSAVLMLCEYPKGIHGGLKKASSLGTFNYFSNNIREIFVTWTCFPSSLNKHCVEMAWQEMRREVEKSCKHAAVIQTWERI